MSDKETVAVCQHYDCDEPADRIEQTMDGPVAWCDFHAEELNE